METKQENTHEAADRKAGTFDVQAHQPVPIWRDVRVLEVFAQVVFVLLVVTIGAALLNNMFGELGRIGAVPDDEFFDRPTRFEISEGPAFNSTDPFARAFYVGVVNTLRVVGAGLIFATILGVLVGVARLSTNYLVNRIALVYVEILRNTPLLVQLVFLYLGVFLALPMITDARPIGGTAWEATPALIGFVAWGIAGAVLAARRDEIADYFMRRQSAAIRGTAFIILYTLSLPLFMLLGGLALGILRFFFPGFLTTTLPTFYLSRLGFWMPALYLTGTFPIWLIFFTIGAVLAVIAWRIRTMYQERTGLPGYALSIALALIMGFSVLGWVAVTAFGPSAETPQQQALAAAAEALEEAGEDELPPLELRIAAAREPIYMDIPQGDFRENAFGDVKLRNVEGGEKVSPEFLALLTGLVLYTSAFIAEVVRAGIQSVDYGQIEAARALGLPYSQILQLVILPQALRVIIPPLGNQYLNLAKNSSLAVAIGFADVYQISTTIAFQSGQSVIMIAMIMITYLLTSLTISTIMNALNRRIQIKER